MTEKQAIKIAIECMKKERQRHIVHANLFRQYGAEWPVFENADKIVTKIDEAIMALNKNEPKTPL